MPSPAPSPTRASPATSLTSSRRRASRSLRSVRRSPCARYERVQRREHAPAHGFVILLFVILSRCAVRESLNWATAHTTSRARAGKVSPRRALRFPYAHRSSTSRCPSSSKPASTPSRRPSPPSEAARVASSCATTLRTPARHRAPE